MNGHRRIALPTYLPPITLLSDALAESEAVDLGLTSLSFMSGKLLNLLVPIRGARRIQETGAWWPQVTLNWPCPTR